MKNVLYLASKSPSRKYLLEQARIPFVVVPQDANEKSCDWTRPVQELVLTIAEFKMMHAQLPVPSYEGQVVYVLSADTLTQDAEGKVHGKPSDYAEAVATVKKVREGARVVTGVCVERRIAVAGVWVCDERVVTTVITEIDLAIADDEIDRYFREHPIALQAAGAIAVEEYGMQYVRAMRGSPTNVIGLPLFEVRQALKKLGFFESAA